MGQGSSRRRSYTPGKTKHTEIAVPPQENGNRVNGSVQVHKNDDVVHIDGVETSASVSTPSTVVRSSSEPVGRPEKRKRFRVGFPFRRSTSGRWSRRKKQGHNGVKPNSFASRLVAEEQQGAASLPVPETDSPSDANAIKTADLESTSLEPQRKNKNSDKKRGKRGSQKRSSTRKATEKKNSKKDEKKNSKKNEKKKKKGSGKDMKVDVDVEGTTNEMIENKSETVSVAEVEKVAYFTCSQHPEVDMKTVATTIVTETVNNAQDSIRADSSNTHISPPEPLGEDADRIFLPNESNTESIYNTRAEQESTLNKPEMIETGDSKSEIATGDILNKTLVLEHQESCDMKHKSEFIVSNTSSDHGKTTNVSKRTYDLIVVSPSLPGQSDEANTRIDGTEIEDNILQPNAKDNDELTPVTAYQAQVSNEDESVTFNQINLQPTDESFFDSVFKNSSVWTEITETRSSDFPSVDNSFNVSTSPELASNEDADYQNLCFGTLPFVELKPQNGLSDENQDLNHLMTDAWLQPATATIAQTDISDPVPASPDTTDQVEVDHIYESPIFMDETQAEAIYVNLPHETKNEAVAEKTVELVIASALDIVAKGRSYENVEKTLQEHTEVADKYVADSENLIKTIPHEDTKMLGSVSLGVEESDKQQEEHTAEDNNRKTAEIGNILEQNTFENTEITANLENQKQIPDMDNQAKHVVTIELMAGDKDKEEPPIDIGDLQQDCTLHNDVHTSETVPYLGEQASSVVICSTVPDRTNLSLDLCSESSAYVISATPSSRVCVTAGDSSGSSPTSPTSYSSRLRSPSSDGESSSFLKKISLGPRLRTAILRKKSNDESESCQEKRLSLTRPKTVESPDIMQHQITLYTETTVTEGHNINNDANDDKFKNSPDVKGSVFINDKLENPPYVGDHVSESTTQSKFEDSFIIFNDSGVADLMSVEAGEGRVDGENNTLCCENLISLKTNIPDLDTEDISIYYSRGGKEELNLSAPEVSAHDEEDDTRPLLNVCVRNEEPPFAQPDIDRDNPTKTESRAITESDVVGLTETKLEVNFDQPCSHEPEIASNCDEPVLSQPKEEVSHNKIFVSQLKIDLSNSSNNLTVQSPERNSSKCFVADLADTEISKQGQPQESAQMEQITSAALKPDICVTSRDRGSAEATIVPDPQPSTGKVSSLMDTTLNLVDSTVTNENYIELTPQEPPETAPSLEEKHNHPLNEELPEEEDAIIAQASNLSQAMPPSNQDQENFQHESVDKRSYSKKNQELQLSNKDLPGVRTIAEFHIGITSECQDNNPDMARTQGIDPDVQSQPETTDKTEENHKLSVTKEEVNESSPPSSELKKKGDACEDASADEVRVKETVNLTFLNGSGDKDQHKQGIPDVVKDATNDSKMEDNVIDKIECLNGHDDIITSVKNGHEQSDCAIVNSSRVACGSTNVQDITNKVSHTNGNISHNNNMYPSDGSKSGSRDVCGTYPKCQCSHNGHCINGGSSLQGSSSSSINEASRKFEKLKLTQFPNKNHDLLLYK